MKILGDLFARVNEQLANSGYVTWSQGFLEGAYVEAVNAVLTVLPVAHAELRDLPLVAGTQQDVPDDVTAILFVMGNATGAGVAGTAVAPVGDMDLFNDEQALLSALSVTASTYQVQRAYLDPMDPLAYYVLPAVPAGYTGKLRSRVGTRPAAPDWNADPDFPLRDGFDIAVKEYMLYIAFGRDDEDSPGFSRAQAHKGNCDAELQRLGTLLGIPAAELQLRMGVSRK